MAEIAPVLKWVGGKRQLLNEILPLVPNMENRTYYEPFIGGGAVLFALRPRTAVINDYNSELVNVYRVVRDHPDELIEHLHRHQNTPEYFYELRNIDRYPRRYNRLTDIEKASRIIFLNKTCFNGLYRVNSKGEYNTPYGRYKNPKIVDEELIQVVGRYFNENEIEILHGDYETALQTAGAGSFVYLDPPYHPISVSSSFTSYVSGGWTEQDQVRLRDVCNDLDQRGVQFLLSNSDCEFIRGLYADYTIATVQAKRNINSNGAKRGNVNEVLIRNY